MLKIMVCFQSLRKWLVLVASNAMRVNSASFSNSSWNNRNVVAVTGISQTELPRLSHQRKYSAQAQTYKLVLNNFKYYLNVPAVLIEIYYGNCIRNLFPMRSTGFKISTRILHLWTTRLLYRFVCTVSYYFNLPTNTNVIVSFIFCSFAEKS